MRSKSACVFKIEYHLVWCVKYRRKILVYPEIDLRLKEILYDISDKIGIQILSMETHKDHIHMLIECTPQHYIPEFVQKFKGITSLQLREEFAIINKYLWGSHIWNRSYFIATVSENTKEQIQKYIDSQKLDKISSM